MLGYFFMTLAVIGLSMNHIFAKVCFYYNPNITNIDLLFFFGIWIAVFYVPAAISNGASFQIFSYKPKAMLILVTSVWLSLAVNFCMLLGISMISVAKSTLVFNLNPVLTMVMATLTLREK